MKNWEDIEIGVDRLPSLFEAVIEKVNFNPACVLRSCWTEKMNKGIEKDAIEKHRLGYGFVGDGYPIERDQTEALKFDKRNLQCAFPKVNYRDVGDAIYQANRILDHCILPSNRKLFILDFGSGYGRLSIPFLYYSKKFSVPITYIGIDFSPSGLITAPQFVSQAVEGCSVRDWEGEGKIDSFDFVSLPAWRIQELIDEKIPVDVFITTHSFQEMTAETIKFYVEVMEKLRTPLSIFYSVNWNMEIESYVPFVTWDVVDKRGFPLNRDGNFNEVVFRSH